MVAPAHLLAFAAASALLIAIPGPSVLFTVGRALSVGRRDALLTVAGNSMGVYVQVLAVALGVGAVVQRSAQLYTTLKLAGGVYLVYLGVQAIRHRRALPAALRGDAAAVPVWMVLRSGIVVGVTNPKTIVFFGALLPQFVDPASGHVPAQMLLLGAVFVLIALTLDSCWALAAGRARSWFSGSPRRLEHLGGAGGLMMVGLGAGVALTGRPD
jgi:threonine/homoserine/homoserine lactone efflux protein